MADSYDEIPYQSIPFTDTHPDNLAMFGRLFGLETPDPSRARVLELGCAGGGNLIPLAFHMPGAQFLGVELSARQVADGQRLIGEIGIDNIRIEQGDILELGRELGEFDYIIAHGVYSWVPPRVQAHILDLCAQHLSPQGVAYISYNTWPGWRMRGVLRDLLLYHTRDIETPGQRLKAALGFLEHFEPMLAQVDSSAAEYLLGELARLKTSHASYLYHEYLEAYNQPQNISDFIATCEGHGLDYLCDADLKSMFPSILGARVEQWLDQFTDLTEQEQYLDYLTNRCFRQSLVCRADAGSTRDIELERLEQQAYFAHWRVPEDLMLDSEQPIAFSQGDDKDLNVGHPLAKAALAHLSREYPDAIPYTELAAAAAAAVRAAGNAPAAEDTSGLLAELFNLFAHQAVGAAQSPRRFPKRPGKHPRAHRLARAQAAQDLGHLATAHHSTILLDPFSAQLVRYLDGSRELSELVGQLTADIAQQRLVLPDLKPATSAVLEAQVKANVERLLHLFVRQGILENPCQA